MREYNSVEETPPLPVGGKRRVARGPSTAQTQAAGVPFVTGALLLILAAVFMAMWRAGNGNVMNVALQFGDKERGLIQQGEWWRLITPIFLHGSPTHLIVNGLSLFWFGSQMERIYGARRYFVIFMLAGVAGNLLSYLMLPTPSLGASGSLFGLVGAGIVLPLRYRRLIADEARNSILRQLTMVTLINFGISLTPGIDRWAHLGGFLGGGIAALFLMPPVLDDRRPNAARDAALTAVTLFALMVTLLAGWSQWRVAGHETPEDMLTYIQSNYWSFQLPARWQQTPVPGDPTLWWVTPARDAALNTRDTPTPPDLTQIAQDWGQVGVPTTTIGGQNALLLARKTTDGTEYQCAISAFGHEIDILVDSKLSADAQVHHDFELMLSSIRFLHAPPPAVPGASTVPGLAVPQGTP